MATLADINETLVRVDDNTETTSRGINSFLKYLENDKRKALEASREEKQAVANTGGRMQSSASGKSSSSGGLLETVKNMLAGASLATLATTLGKGLLKRVLGPAVIAGFAEEIVEYLLPEGFENQAIKDALTGGLQGAAIGFMVGGPLGAAIGGGIGALLKNEKFKKAVEDLGVELKQMGKDLYEKLEPTVINFKNNFLDFFDALGITKEGVVQGLALTLTTIGDAAASGVESLTKIVKGDFSGMDLIKGIGFLGTVAAILMPGKFMKLFGMLAMMAKGGVGKTLTGIMAGGGAMLSSAAAMLGLGPDKNMVTAKSGKQYHKDSPQGKMIQNMTKKTGETAAKGAAGIAKYPKLLKALNFLKGVPLVGGIAALSQIAMMDPVTVDKLAGVLGGIGGAALGGMVGALTPIPGGLLIGTGLGAVLGDTLAKAAAQYLMGKKVDAFGFGFGWLNDLINGKEDSKKTVQPQTKSYGMSPGAMGGKAPTTVTRPDQIGATTMKSNISSGMSPGAMGGATTSPPINLTNNNNSSTQNQSLIVGHPSTRDTNNSINQRLNIGLA